VGDNIPPNTIKLNLMSRLVGGKLHLKLPISIDVVKGSFVEGLQKRSK